MREWNYVLLLLFHSTSQSINGAPGLFLFGIAGALLAITFINTITSFTSREYTGILLGCTNMMTIVGGVIGPVITTLILASVTLSTTVDNVAKSYPSPVAFNIMFAVGVIMAIASVFLDMRMKHLATEHDAVNSQGHNVKTTGEDLSLSMQPSYLHHTSFSKLGT